MVFSFRAFKKALNDIIMSRRAIRNMNTLYPDATEEDLALGKKYMKILLMCWQVPPPALFLRILFNFRV